MTPASAGAGPRRLSVAGERVDRWIQGFVQRHAPVAVVVTPDRVRLEGADGATADIDVPFPPLSSRGGSPVDALPPEELGPVLAAHVLAPRVVGVLLVRRGGFAVGIFDAGRLVAAKAGSRHVQGRTAAGGWSQQRFARRREGQARVARDAAADTAVSVLLPEARRLDALVLGGDRRSGDLVLEDPRLAPLRTLLAPFRLDVPDPRRAVLEGCAADLRTLRILVDDPTGRART